MWRCMVRVAKQASPWPPARRAYLAGQDCYPAMSWGWWPPKRTRQQDMPTRAAESGWSRGTPLPPTSDVNLTWIALLKFATDDRDVVDRSCLR